MIDRQKRIAVLITAVRFFTVFHLIMLTNRREPILLICVKTILLVLEMSSLPVSVDV